MVGLCCSYNWAYYLAFILFFIGLGYVAAAFGAGRRNTTFKDRLFMGAALVATAFVTVVLFGESWGGDLFSDAASSVSGAPGSP